MTVAAAAACTALGGSPSSGPSLQEPAVAGSVVAETQPPSPSPTEITEARAIELARGHSSLVTLVSAEMGPFHDLYIPQGVPGKSPDLPVKRDRIVWAVTFSGDVTICSPVGSCSSPRPAVMVVFLDHLTGSFLMSETNAPAH